MTQNGVLIDCGSSKVNELISIADSLQVNLSKVSLWEADVTEFTEAEVMIISGGPHLFTDPSNERLRSQFDFLSAVSMPILGICLGHQALALAAGAEVYRDREERFEVSIEILQPEHRLFEGIPNSTKFGQDHCEGATLPKGYSHLAFSEHYANEAMANEVQGRYGVQFHPEISGKYGRKLIQNFFEVAANR